MESKEPQEDKKAGEDGNEVVLKKHEKLQDDKGEQDVELIQNKHTKQLASPFINHTKSWDDEECFKIP